MQRSSAKTGQHKEKKNMVDRQDTRTGNQTTIPMCQTAYLGMQKLHFTKMYSQIWKQSKKCYVHN